MKKSPYLLKIHTEMFIDEIMSGIYLKESSVGGMERGEGELQMKHDWPKVDNH